MSEWHLAQLNVGQLRAPIEHPDPADFADNLDPVNALAEAAPGFVWRLQDEGGNATGFARDVDGAGPVAFTFTSTFPPPAEVPG